MILRDKDFAIKAGTAAQVLQKQMQQILEKKQLI